jgi:hypothetical protein
VLSASRSSLSSIVRVRDESSLGWMPGGEDIAAEGDGDVHLARSIYIRRVWAPAGGAGLLDVWPARPGKSGGSHTSPEIEQASTSHPMDVYPVRYLHCSRLSSSSLARNTPKRPAQPTGVDRLCHTIWSQIQPHCASLILPFQKIGHFLYDCA